MIIVVLYIVVYYSFGDGIAYPTRTVDISSDSLLADRQRWMEEGDADGGKIEEGGGEVL